MRSLVVLRSLKSSYSKRCGFLMSARENYRMAMRRGPLLSEVSQSSLFLTSLGLMATCYVMNEKTSEYFHFDKCRHFVVSAGMMMTNLMEATRTNTTQMDYLEHDIHDYDIYIKNPTAKDLPYLLKQFDEHGKEVWPWIWTHPNDAGPHFVFVGVNTDTLDQIRKLRSKSPTYNILVIASEESIIKAANDAGDPNIYEETHCGIVSDATLELLNAEAKILMLSDERVISFDSLTIT